MYFILIRDNFLNRGEGYNNAHGRGSNGRPGHALCLRPGLDWAGRYTYIQLFLVFWLFKVFLILNYIRYSVTEITLTFSKIISIIEWDNTRMILLYNENERSQIYKRLANWCIYRIISTTRTLLLSNTNDHSRLLIITVHVIKH
jgi:hypothetical protein